jgi:hypothetical protein
MRLAKLVIMSTALPFAVASCTTTAQAPVESSHAALPVMERVALGANQCWFKSGDPAFAAYKLAPELDSYSGTPRILLVKKHSPEARPLLVVQASGNPAQLQAFGPAMNEPALSTRVNTDVHRWANGAKGC